MTVRRMRGASLGVAGALVAGLVIAPSGGATAAGSDGLDFYSVPATPVASSSDSGGSDARAGSRSATTTDAARTAAVSSGLQALQVFNGANSIGNNGLTVAAGPRQVMQVGGPTVRILAKNNGNVVKTWQLSQLLNVPGTTFSQGTVVYDPLGKRWIVAAVAEDGGDIGLALRVTTGTNPSKLAQWQPTVLFAGGNDTGNPDAVELNPMIGTSSDKIVITTPITDADEPGNVNRIFFFPKGPIYNGSAPNPWTSDLNSTWNGQAPAVNASGQNNISVAIPSTDDVQTSVFTGAATSSAPIFSKIVVYPSSLTAPPLVDQGGAADDLDLGPLAFSGAAWRSGKLFAAAAGNCAGDACIRLIGISTEGGGTLIEDEKYKSTTGADWFSPSVAIDGAGYVHTAATAVSSNDLGPSLAVLTLTKISLANTAGTNLKARVIGIGTESFDDGTPGGTIDWSGSTGAAIDPTSPWDVWVTGAVGSNVASPNLTTSIARVSMAKNNATIKASSTRVKKGSKVTFTCKLSRPDSKDTIRGLPITLQRKGGGKWKKIASGTTNNKGVFKSTQTIRNAGQYRTLGRAVTQLGGQGQAVDKVASKPISIRLR